VAKNIILGGITVGSRKMLTDMLACIDANKIKPVVDKVFAFDDLPKAYAYLSGASHMGKIVIKHS
jgi:D-arabinose 1-dehydrogenase-like Zn-dependent alcohol dehydrogenase